MGVHLQPCCATEQGFVPIGIRPPQSIACGCSTCCSHPGHLQAYDVLSPSLAAFNNAVDEGFCLLPGTTQVDYRFSPGVDLIGAGTTWFGPDTTRSLASSAAWPSALLLYLTPATSQMPVVSQAAIPDSVATQCPYKCNGTFSRVGEYRRHMKKHAKHCYPCTQAGCGKSFYRNDKLRDHLWQGHQIETRQRSRRARQS